MSTKARLRSFQLLGTILERLPERLDVALVEAAFGVVGRTAIWRRTALRDNIAAALGADEGPLNDGLLDRMAARGARGYGRYWAEGAKLPAMRPEDVTARIVFSEGGEHMRDAVAAGRGVIMVLPHVGSWEWGGAFLADIGWTMTAVAERLEPPELYDYFVRQRERMGLRVVPLDERAGGAIARVLRAGGVVGLLADRDIQGNGIPARLLGRDVSVPAGPAMLAMRSGATLLCAAVYSGPGEDHHVVVTPPVDTSRRGQLREDVARVTQAVTDELGWLIRRAPEQWHVLQRVLGPAA